MTSKEVSRKEDKRIGVIGSKKTANSESSLEKIFNWLEKYQLILLFLGIWIGIFVISYLIKVIK